jgi:hypothetical protein
MAAQCFDCLLSDDEMRAQLERGEPFFFKLPQWHLIEHQIERLGFEDGYFVTQVDARRGTLIKVTPVVVRPSQPVRHAA